MFFCYSMIQIGYGMSPNTTSWGGGAIYEASTQLYHLYVARMTNDCLLEDWTQNSRVDHATSKSITGPYEFQDVAINTWFFQTLYIYIYIQLISISPSLFFSRSIRYLIYIIML